MVSIVRKTGEPSVALRRAQGVSLRRRREAHCDQRPHAPTPARPVRSVRPVAQGKSASKPRRSPLRRGRQRPQLPRRRTAKACTHARRWRPAAGNRRTFGPLSAAELADRVAADHRPQPQPRTGGGRGSWRAGHSPPRTPPTRRATVERPTRRAPSNGTRNRRRSPRRENGVEPCKTRTCPSGRPSVSAAPTGRPLRLGGGDTNWGRRRWAQASWARLLGAAAVPQPQPPNKPSS